MRYHFVNSSMLPCVCSVGSILETSKVSLPDTQLGKKEKKINKVSHSLAGLTLICVKFRKVPIDTSSFEFLL